MVRIVRPKPKKELKREVDNFRRDPFGSSIKWLARIFPLGQGGLRNQPEGHDFLSDISVNQTPTPSPGYTWEPDPSGPGPRVEEVEEFDPFQGAGGRPKDRDKTVPSNPPLQEPGPTDPEDPFFVEPDIPVPWNPPPEDPPTDEPDKPPKRKRDDDDTEDLPDCVDNPYLASLLNVPLCTKRDASIQIQTSKFRTHSAKGPSYRKGRSRNHFVKKNHFQQRGYSRHFRYRFRQPSQDWLS